MSPFFSAVNIIMNPSHGPLDPRFALVTTASGSVVVELAGAAGASPAPKTSGAAAPAAGADTPLGPDGKPLSKSALKKMKKGKGNAKEKKDKPKVGALAAPCQACVLRQYTWCYAPGLFSVQRSQG